MGRRTILDEALVKQLIDMICDGVAPDVAAGAAGINRATYYDWRARGRSEEVGIYADFDQAIEQALQICEARAARAVARAFPKDWQSALAMLERRFPDRWGRRQRVDVYEHERVRQEAERIAARYGITAEEVLQRANVALPSPN
jgi:transposase